MKDDKPQKLDRIVPQAAGADPPRGNGNGTVSNLRQFVIWIAGVIIAVALLSYYNVSSLAREVTKNDQRIVALERQYDELRDGQQALSRQIDWQSQTLVNVAGAVGAKVPPQEQ